MNRRHLVAASLPAALALTRLGSRNLGTSQVAASAADVTSSGWNAFIAVVWPHDIHGNYAPVGQATRVNIAFDLFAPGTRRSVASTYEPWGIGLMIAQSNDPLQGSSFARPTKTPYTVDGQTYPRWVYNDVPVAPGRQYHFAIWTATGQNGGIGNTNFWTHAADARTYLPKPSVPPTCTS